MRAGPLIRLSTKELMLLNCGAGEHSWEFLKQQGDQTSKSQRKSTLNIHWKDWSWSSNTLAIWCEELTHLKRPWCWETLRIGEGGNRRWDGWMASWTQWTWIWASSWSWWWSGKHGSMGLQRVEHNWATEVELNLAILIPACNLLSPVFACCNMHVS